MVFSKEFSKSELERILPLPELSKRILKNFLTKSDREIEDFVSSDEEIQSFLINCANLPRYRKTPAPITNIRGALLVLGEKTVRILTLGLISQTLMKKTFNEFNYQKFWARAISNLVIAYFLSDLIENFPSHLPVSAYLLDFGILVMYQFNPEKYLEVLLKKQAGRPHLEVERDIFGITHPEVGAAYFEEYAFPRRFILNLRYHHEDPNKSISFDVKKDLSLLRLIDNASRSFFGYDRELRWESFKELAGSYLSNEELENLGNILPTIINNYLEVFSLEEYKIKTLEEWREEKEKELKKLNLIEEKNAKDFENKYLALIREKNDIEERLHALYLRLNETTIIDDWTQIYRPRYFLKRLKEEILRARRYGRSFSLLAIKFVGLDIIRKKYGLSEGEIFIKELVNELKTSIRRTDILGKATQEDQVWLLLPETKSQGAMVVARKLLRKIEDLFYKKYQINGFAYISVIAYEPKTIDYKREPDENKLVMILQQGHTIMQRKGQNRILLLRLEQDLEE